MRSQERNRQEHYLPVLRYQAICLLAGNLSPRDGAVLGTAEFVNGVFESEQERRKRFGEKRTTGARTDGGQSYTDGGQS